MVVRHTRDDVKQPTTYVWLEFREEIWVGDILGGHYHIGNTEDMQGNKTNEERPVQSEERKIN